MNVITRSLLFIGLFIATFSLECAYKASKLIPHGVGIIAIIYTTDLAIHHIKYPTKFCHSKAVCDNKLTVLGRIHINCYPKQEDCPSIRKFNICSVHGVDFPEGRVINAKRKTPSIKQTPIIIYYDNASDDNKAPDESGAQEEVAAEEKAAQESNSCYFK